MDLIEVTKEMEKHPKVVSSRRACIITGILILIVIVLINIYTAIEDGIDLEQIILPTVMKILFIWPLIMIIPLYMHHVTKNKIYELIKAEYAWEEKKRKAATDNQIEQYECIQSQEQPIQNINKVNKKASNILLNIGASYLLGKVAMKTMDSLSNSPSREKMQAEIAARNERYKRAQEDAKARIEELRELRKRGSSNGGREKVTFTNGYQGTLERYSSGSIFLRDSTGRTVARYDKSRNVTYKGDGSSILGRGNCIYSLLK